MDYKSNIFYYESGEVEQRGFYEKENMMVNGFGLLKMEIKKDLSSI